MDSKKIALIYVVLAICLAFFIRPLWEWGKMDSYLNFVSAPNKLSLFLLSILSLFFLSYQYIVNKSWKQPIVWVDTLFALYVGWGFFSIAWATHQTNALFYAFFNLSLLGAYFIFKEIIYQHTQLFFKVVAYTLGLCVLLFIGNSFYKGLMLHYERVSAYGELYGYAGFNPSVFYSIQSFVGSKSHTAMFAYLCIVLLLSSLSFVNKTLENCLKFVVAIAILFVLLLFTRSVLIGLGGAGLVYLFFFRPSKKIFLLGAGFAGLMTISLYLFTDYTYYLQASSISEVLLSRTVSFRYDLWDRAWQLFLDNPIFGTGLAQWDALYRKFGVVDSMLPFKHWVHPHNDYLRNLMELGSIGFLCFCGIFILQINQGVQLLKAKEKDANSKRIIALVLAGIVGYHLIIQFDQMQFYFSKQLLLMIIWAILAVFIGRQMPLSQNAIGKGTKMILPIAMIVCMFVSMIYYGLFLRGDFYAYKAIEAKKNKDWQQVLTNVDKAYNPAYDAYRLQPLKGLEALGNRKLGNAEQALQNGLDLLQTHPYNRAELTHIGRQYLEQGDLEQASKYLTRAFEVNSCHETARIYLAELYVQQARYKEALELTESIQSERKRKNLFRKIDKAQKTLQK